MNRNANDSKERALAIGNCFSEMCSAIWSTKCCRCVECRVPGATKATLSASKCISRILSEKIVFFAHGD